LREWKGCVGGGGWLLVAVVTHLDEAFVLAGRCGALVGFAAGWLGWKQLDVCATGS
jgi:hypothetical protein